VIWGLKTDYTNISPSRYLWVTILAVFVAELLIMFLVDFIDFGNVWVTALFDSMVLSLALFVINYRLMARPLIFHKKALEDHVQELLEARQELEASNLHLSELAHDLEEQREKAEAASMAKSQFLSIMSHELRTPLNAVIGFSEIIKEQLFGPVGVKAYVDYANDIHSSGLHLLLLVDDVLDMSRIESGNFKPMREEFALAEAARDSFKLVEGRAGRAEVQLINAIPADLPPLYADKRAIKQVLINLLTNAVKFNKPRGSVTLDCALSDEAFTITVKDTGIGIDAKDLERVLEPFAQIEREKGRVHEGAGLGLPLSKSLIEAHGGIMKLESLPGQGTTVFLTVPRGIVAQP